MNYRGRAKSPLELRLIIQQAAARSKPRDSLSIARVADRRANFEEPR
jgi:hypothetical protein